MNENQNTPTPINFSTVAEPEAWSQEWWDWQRDIREAAQAEYNALMNKASNEATRALNEYRGEVSQEEEEAETWNKLDEEARASAVCPVCGEPAGPYGSGCCSGRCWGDMYGEP